jgi:VWFA-related protein
MRYSRYLAAACVIAASASIPAAAPQQPIRVGTNFVRVDAYPMKDGQIVTGLEAADFEVLEDGVVQKVETFEHVLPMPGPYTARTEPSSQREMTRELGKPRSRVFLIFLDGLTVDRAGSHYITEPVVKFLRDTLADDDLVGVMTPGMSAGQVAFGRKTDVIETAFRTNLDWGRLNRELDPELDKRLIQYGLCYPAAGDVGAKMIARAKERITLEALQDAVKYLHNLREERKAIVTITGGWPLYREDPDLMRKREREFPIGVDPIRAGPNGKLTNDDKRNNINTLSANQCDNDRMYLCAIDDEKYLREIIDDANRGNASFYLIDPGGLRTNRPADRSAAMRTLADNTDGMALLNTNDLDRGFKRLADDMSSYYLLGYYASNSKSDGRYRTITVRVKQPGVTVRARKGYRAPSAAEVSAAVRESAPAAAAETPAPVRGAIESLERIRPGSRLHVRAVANNEPVRKVWVEAELQSTGTKPDEFMQGATATVEVVANGASTSQTIPLKSTERSFVAKFDLPSGAAGMLDVRVRLVSDEGVAAPLAEGARLDLAAPQPSALMFRRGVTTGNRMVAAADPRISRTERVRLEIPVPPGPKESAVTGRVLDRNGAATVVPVAVGERSDETSGQRWITADVTLGPLSPADYAIEISIVRGTRTDTVMTPIRVVR